MTRLWTTNQQRWVIVTPMNVCSRGDPYGRLNYRLELATLAEQGNSKAQWEGADFGRLQGRQHDHGAEL